jgi:hypothetical protein
MRQDLNEIKKVFDEHGYSINNSICDVMKKFKFKTLCWQSGAEGIKEEGYSFSEIVALLIMIPVMLLNSVHALYRSAFNKTTEMKKDTIYRLKNDERMPWRRLQYAVAKKFQELVNPQKEVAENSAFIIDDTIDERVGYKIENITSVYDHVAGKTGCKYGFKNLVLGFFDGKSITPLDFSLHTEKALPKKKREKQFKKDCIKNSNGFKRRAESKVDKIKGAISLIKRAVKNGFLAKYVLVDSWFTSLDFIKEIREIKNGAMHLIGGIRNDSRKYIYNGETLNGKQLIKKLSAEGKQKRCRKWNVRYFEVVVNYEGIGDVKLYICRFPYQKKWRIFISTDVSLNFIKMMEIYSTRWTVEVMFRELKQHLHLGKCQSRDFDAQIASITISMILYTFLAYLRRKNAYETIGGIFELINEDMCEKTLAQRLWELFDDLLQVVIDSISKSGSIDILLFKDSPEYRYIKELFESSFLNKQLLALNKPS